MPKPNSRSFRYSDEVKLILEKYNNDFDSLVVEAFLRLPEADRQKVLILKDINYLKKQRSSLIYEINELKSIKSQIEYLERSINYLGNRIEKM